jgi:altronate dehydratase small subunit
MKDKARAVVIHEKDTVATSLEPLHRGAEIPVEIQHRTQKMKLLAEIPAGHKFALIDMEEGTDVIKYGEPIGQSTAKIARGEHVHTHNMTSRTEQGSR